ncbi:hypothetical protein TUMEXPCC7403_15690 [Tumidithrix helvetica PCC 7403]|uniref:hypothetical protein n=1 Tax=Tumidithrix helvetica TaxID=3457545 RepID=UPI003C89FC9D
MLPSLIQFSSQKFQELGESPWASRALADSLEEKAYYYLMPLMEARLRCIVQAMNRLGHDLKIIEKRYDSIEYCSDFDEEDGYCYGLMICCDLTISTGYADTIPDEEACDDIPDERQIWESLINPEIVNTYQEISLDRTDENDLEDFSLQNFLQADDLQTKELLEQLKININEKLHNQVLTGVIDIINDLNKQGHNLQVYGEIDIGSIPFRDDFIDDNGYHCKLRLGVNVLTIVNFRTRKILE